MTWASRKTKNITSRSSVTSASLRPLNSNVRTTMAQKRTLFNLVLGSLYPCLLFSAESKDIPLKMRLRRKQNRIWLCENIKLYVRRWYYITSVLGAITAAVIYAYGFTLVAWCCIMLFVISIGTLYIMLDLQNLHPPELEVELLKQLEKHDVSDF